MDRNIFLPALGMNRKSPSRACRSPCESSMSSKRTDALTYGVRCLGNRTTTAKNGSKVEVKHGGYFQCVVMAENVGFPNSRFLQKDNDESLNFELHSQTSPCFAKKGYMNTQSHGQHANKPIWNFKLLRPQIGL
jgi:hypothetical protein